jgi:phenylpyruvate tautomerase PptA (4-oxalocrotonate tautomerase family)
MVMLLARSSGPSIVAYIECDVKVQTGRLRPREGGLQMPIVKIHVLEGRYDERRLGNVSRAVQDALESILKVPSDDFYQVIHELPRNRFLHTPSFVGMKYSDDFILLEIAFISGRPKETRLALLKELNARIVAGAKISPDDLMIQLSEFPGENYSFGQGLAQRAFIAQETREA